MAFTEYRFDPAFLAARIEEVKKNLKANTGFSDLVGFSLNVIATRLMKDPRRYLDYGPYWWAVKDLLNAAGYVMGAQSDPMILKVYRGATPAETIVAADTFRDDYLKSQFIYTDMFMLDASTPDWRYVLFDHDMEARLATQNRARRAESEF